MSKARRKRFSRRDVLLGSLGALAAQSCRSAAGAARPSSQPNRNAFDLDTFVADCVAANSENPPQVAVQEVMQRAFRNPGAVLAAVGEPTEAGIRVLHRSKTLTMFAATWTPQMNLMPHNHLMWALIGIYTGREDNILWRRSQQGGSGRALCEHGVQALFAGDVAALPETAIHSVTNPLRRFTGGIHVYGGDFFAMSRSQWNPETLAEEPSDGDVIRAIFRQENERMRRG
jgi:predicted metal-dependent enzyme (double-stranded beta helix superfamily)